MAPKISVIIPIYQVEDYIERCLHSLLCQTLDDIEYIFVNDASPDTSIERIKQICSKYPLRRNIKIIEHKKNCGVAAARNTGIVNATGDYVVFCDGDDWVELDMYEKLYMKAVSEDYDIVACDFSMHFSDHTEMFTTVDSCSDKIFLLKKYMMCGWTVLWNFIAKRSLYYNYDIRFYENCNFGEDYGVSVRLMNSATSYARISEPLYHYNRCNENSIVNKSNIRSKKDKTTESQVEIYKKINAYFKSENLYEDLKDVLSWRMLAAKRGWLLNFSKRKEYLDLYPESNSYINSNPLCSAKDKFCQKIFLKFYWWIFLIPLKYLFLLKDLKH